MNDAAGQLSYSTTQGNLRAGSIADAGFRDVVTLVNDSGRTAQVVTVTVDTVTNSATYTVTVNGVAVSYTADSSTADTEIVAGLVAAVNAEPLIRGAVVAASASSTTLTITSRVAGVGFTFEESDAKLSYADTTANDEGDEVPFGSLVYADATRTKGVVASTSTITKMTETITVGGTAENSKDIALTVTVHLPDGPRTYQVFAASTGSATVNNTASAIQAALSAAIPTSEVVFTVSAAVVTATSAVEGQTFHLAALAQDVTTMTVTVAAGSVGAYTDSRRMLAGVAVLVDRHESGYPVNTPMNVLRRGRVVVATDATVDPSGRVYVKLADGKSFRSTATSGYVLVPNASWHSALSSTRAVLQLG